MADNGQLLNSLRLVGQVLHEGMRVTAPIAIGPVAIANGFGATKRWHVQIYDAMRCQGFSQRTLGKAPFAR